MADRSKKPKQNTVFGGMAILAVGIAAVKVIGALFKIPLFNILGETGTADFNNAYNIYAVLLTVSTAGLPVALSKTVAEASALGRYNQERRVFRVALGAFLTMGVASFAVMWLGSERLAALLHNSHAAPGIRALAPAVVCVGCLSAFRGYAQGHLDMAPTSVSQIIEALCKLFLGLGLALLIMNGSLLSVGAEERTSYAAAGAITGVTVGTALALGYMALDHARKRRRVPRGTDTPDSTGTILRNLMRIAVPITLSTTMVPIINVIDNALVQGRLQNALGYSETASRALYGNYSVAANLHNLPGSFMTALTAAIIPAVAACLAHRDRKGASRMIGSVLRLTALLAMPMGVGLLALSRPIMRLLYPRYDDAMTGRLLALLGPASILVCLVLVTNAILQAYGYVRLPILTTLLGGGVKILTNYHLVAKPDVNIFGAPIGTLLCYGTILTVNLIVLRREIRQRGGYTATFVKPALASAAMGGAAWAIYGLLSRGMIRVNVLCAEGVLTRGGNAAAVAAAIGGAAVLYLILVLSLRIVSHDDLMLMPKGEKIAKILKI